MRCLAMLFLLAAANAALATDGYPNTAFGGQASDPGTAVLSSVALDVSHEGPPLENVRVAVQSDDKIVMIASQTDGTIAFARLTTDGILDTSFNSTGIHAVSVLSPDENVSTDLLIQSTGNIVGVGYATYGAGNLNAECVAFRLKTTGALDTSFHSNGTYAFAAPSSTRTRCFRVRTQSDGSLLLAGDQLVSGSSVMMVARLNATTGVLDSSFGSGGIAHSSLPSGYTGASAMSVVQLPNGKLIAVGYAYAVVSDTYQYYWDLTRFSSTGVFDTTFGTSGHLIVPFTGLSSHQLDSAMDVIADSDDGFVVVGAFSNSTVGDETAVARFTAAGAADSTFGTSSGQTIFYFSQGAVASPSEMIVDKQNRFVGVGFSQYASSPCPLCYSMTVFRLLPNGLFDTTFGVDAAGIYGDTLNLQGSGVALSNDEGVFVAVAAQTGETSWIPGLFKLIGDTIFGNGFEGD